MALTTVAFVQAYLGLPSTQDPTVLQSLVDSASSFAERLIGRSLSQADYSETYNGTGGRQIVCRNAPVTSVSSVSVGKLSIPAAADSEASGFVFDSDIVYLRGYMFDRGVQNIAISYVAGYPDGTVTDEPVNVPSSSPYTATLISGASMRAITSLTYSVGGSALTQVGSNPVAGQYTLSGSTLGFSSADAGKALLCTYTTIGVPADIQQAVAEMVGVKYQRRDRLDIKQKILAQQTIAYDMSDVPPQSMAVLQSYRRYLVNP